MADPKSGVELIAAERARQIEVEGYSIEHDEYHAGAALAIAACCYALPQHMRKWRHHPGPSLVSVPTLWPWSPSDWKPSDDDRVRDLVKAGALLAAEIDRIQRAGGASGG
jgi:hypothetical protein